MTTKTCVHIKKAILAFPELHEDGATDKDGNALINRASFIIDVDAPEYDEMAPHLDAALRAATLREFGSEEAVYDKMPVVMGEDIKGRDGKSVKWLRGKISITADNIQRPALFNSAKEEVGPDPDLFYAGAEVYGIIEFVARRVGDKKYLNARLRGILHRGHGTPLDSRAVTLATADEFEFEAA